MKNLKLNTLASENLSGVEMNQVKGGTVCGCGCAGSSSTDSNGSANNKNGLYSKGVPLLKQELVVTP